MATVKSRKNLAQTGYVNGTAARQLEMPERPHVRREQSHAVTTRRNQEKALPMDLPFVIMPLYTTMIKMDKSLIEASYDLGANKVETFLRTILPMTMPGIISAATMVFMPTMSSYVISDVMGERKISLIGNSIQLYFDQGLWHMGSLVALIMLILIATGMLLTDSENEDNPRGGIW